MNDLSFCEMQEIQKELQEKYKDKWGGLGPEKAKDKFLWMMIEAGEAADVIKKNGGGIVRDKEVRKHFIEEMCDVMIYFNDILICYDITPEELAEVYREKHKRNMQRW